MPSLTALMMILGKEPAKEFPLLIYQAHLKKLAGHYESYKGSSSYEICAKDGTLWIKYNQWKYEVPMMRCRL